MRARESERERERERRAIERDKIVKRGVVSGVGGVCERKGCVVCERRRRGIGARACVRVRAPSACVGVAVAGCVRGRQEGRSILGWAASPHTLLLRRISWMRLFRAQSTGPFKRTKISVCSTSSVRTSSNHSRGRAQAQRMKPKKRARATLGSGAFPIFSSAPSTTR